MVRFLPNLAHIRPTPFFRLISTRSGRSPATLEGVVDQWVALGLCSPSFAFPRVYGKSSPNHPPSRHRACFHSIGNPPPNLCSTVFADFSRVLCLTIGDIAAVVVLRSWLSSGRLRGRLGRHPGDIGFEKLRALDNRPNPRSEGHVSAKWPKHGVVGGGESWPHRQDRSLSFAVAGRPD